MFDDKVVLVTGGTGSFGQKFVETVLKRYKPQRVIVFSRDELKQFEMRQRLPDTEYPALRYFIGDIRDRERLVRALDGVDYVVHAAALKQVPACEYNPLEAVKTNILGAANLIDAAIDRKVSRIVALSTDKAASPVNLYGATKLCSDKLFISGNNYAGSHDTRFSVVRYGNVVGSRGSVIPHFLKLRPTGVLPVTDPRMTRFWITLERGVDLVLEGFSQMKGGEIFVPKIPSMNIMDLANALAPECRTEVVGIRPGEKLHEVLLTADDARHSFEYSDHYVIAPEFRTWDSEDYSTKNGGAPCAEAFVYSSDKNSQWLTIDQLRALVKPPTDQQVGVPSVMPAENGARGPREVSTID